MCSGLTWFPCTPLVRTSCFRRWFCLRAVWVDGCRLFLSRLWVLLHVSSLGGAGCFCHSDVLWQPWVSSKDFLHHIIFFSNDFLVATLINLSAAETVNNYYMIAVYLCVFQWAIPLQCLRLTVHLRNRWIITTVYTWRLCLNFSTDIKPATDLPTLTSCASSRNVGKHKVNEIAVWNIMWDRYKKRKMYVFLYWCHVNVLAF